MAAGPLPVRLAWVAVRDPERERSAPLPADVPVGVEPGELGAVDAVVELAGGVDRPREWATAALGAGLPYVTANKALLASHGGELADLAHQNGAALLASASVGGGTPMLEVTEHLAATGAIRRLRGLLNATTTFILSAMGEGRTYDDALTDAQAAGFAEADPTLDVNGHDAAQKLAILAWVAWGRWRSEGEVQTQGIVGLDVAPGAAVRLVAEATPDALRVAPVALLRRLTAGGAPWRRVRAGGRGGGPVHACASRVPVPGAAPRRARCMPISPGWFAANDPSSERRARG